VNVRFADWIWHVKGSLALPGGQSSEDAFARLAPLFREIGTSHDRAGDTLVFSKKDQPAQDKMSVFDSGVLHIEQGSSGPVLRYNLASRALLFCFLAPLLFLSFAGLTLVAGRLEQPPAKTAEKKDEKKDKVLVQNPVDKFLGAPAPEKPKKDDKKKKDEDDKPQPTAAYVFAGIFVALYLIGRVLEDRLVRSLFRKKLAAL